MKYKSKKRNALERIRNSAIPVTCIVDVGVERQTEALILVYPDVVHHLFEPVSMFYEDIQRNYSKVDFLLHEMALADETNRLYCIVRALRKDGKPTHARLDSEPVHVDGFDIVSCSEVAVKRYDDICKEISHPNFLLKLDVDGTELKVLDGMGDHLQKSSAIVIEVTYNNIFKRAEYLVERGFVLVDIVDIVYYGNSLYQCDLIFVRSDLVNERLRPPIKDFKGELWNNAVIG